MSEQSILKKMLFCKLDLIFLFLKTIFVQFLLLSPPSKKIKEKETLAQADYEALPHFMGWKRSISTERLTETQS